jgi:ribonuclease HI
MRELAREAQAVIAGADVTFEWIAREFNSRADAVANASMDRRDSFD